MIILRALRQPLVTAIWVGLSIAAPAMAQHSLPDLMAELRAAPPEAAMRLDRQIRAEWSKSGSPSMDLLLRRGQTALEEDDTEAAIEHLTALTDHAPDFAEGWHQLARAYFTAELYGPALDALGKALALNPDQYHALFGLGVMFHQFGEHRRAEEAYLSVLDLYPHHEEAKEALDALKREGIGREL